METLFYIRDNSEKSVWAINKIDVSEGNRLGWLNGVCMFPGNNLGNYIGGEIGIDAERVFTNSNYDVSKSYESLMPR